MRRPASARCCWRSSPGGVPTVAEAQNLANWAVAFGPGGSFWRGRSFPSGTAVTDIEFGNETNNPYQFGFTEHWYEEPAFIQRAEEYARRLRDAQVAIAATGAPVGLLAIGDQYGGHTSWDEAMFRAVPDLGQRVAGWTVHPYGPEWWSEIDNEIAQTQAHGAPSSIPIYITEWGVSSDNGRCLSDNFGWNRCMTYQEAAEALGSTVAGMRARYGSRLRAPLRLPGPRPGRHGHLVGARILLRGDAEQHGAQGRLHGRGAVPPRRESLIAREQPRRTCVHAAPARSPRAEVRPKDCLQH